MSRSFFTVLLVMFTALWVLYLYSNNSLVAASQIEWFDVFSEIFTLCFILFLIIVNLRLQNQYFEESKLLYVGLCLLFIGHSHDLLDEVVVVQPKIITLFLENIVNNLGLVVLTLAILRWSGRYKLQLLSLEKQTRELAAESFTDPLTNLYNRRFLNQLVIENVESQVKTGEHYSAILLDIDNFKAYNDEFGHLEGDSVIKYCSDAIINSSRPNDFAFRYGGEEFLLVINGDSQVAMVVAERIRSMFEAYQFKPQPDTVVSKTVSIGVVELSVGHSFSESLQLADDALYQAKNQGKNQVVLAHC